MSLFALKAIPLLLGGGDVMVAAETGSGKTGAFALPALQVVHERLRGEASGSASASVGGGGGEGAAGEEAKEGPVEWRLSSKDRDAVMAVSPDGAVCQ